MSTLFGTGHSCASAVTKPDAAYFFKIAIEASGTDIGCAIWMCEVLQPLSRPDHHQDRRGCGSARGAMGEGPGWNMPSKCSSAHAPSARSSRSRPDSPPNRGTFFARKTCSVVAQLSGLEYPAARQSHILRFRGGSEADMITAAAIHALAALIAIGKL